MDDLVLVELELTDVLEHLSQVGLDERGVLRLTED
jgi:hypothetical protein